MTNSTSRLRSCRLLLVHNKLVVLRDDFLSDGLRVGNNEEAEILSLSYDRNNQNDASIGEAILRAFSQARVIDSLLERTHDYVPPYVLATNFRKFEDFLTSCSSCGCIESQDHVFLFPTMYGPAQGQFQQDRSRQISSSYDPIVLGHTALELLTRL